MLKVMAKEAGMNEGDAKKWISTFEFLPVDVQLSKQWLGGDVQTFMKSVAELFVSTGNIKKVLPNYDNAVNTAPLKQVAK